MPSFKQMYEPGAHEVHLKDDWAIDLTKWPLKIFWVARPDDVMPIAFALNCPGVQLVLCLALAQDGRELTCKVLQQKATVSGQTFDLVEIYGLTSLNIDEKHDESTAGEPCVVCLEEPRNTLLKPCRHLCVCEDCGVLLRDSKGGNTCPICRHEIQGLATFTL